MDIDANNPSEVEHRLWDEIEKHQIGMLMLVGGPPRHAQPMTAFVERDERQLWFFADTGSEMVTHIGQGQRCMFVWQQRELQACIGGRLREVRQDKRRVAKYWNAVVAAWRPGGRRDPSLTLLAMDCDDAEVWMATTGPIKAVWEIAKANAVRRTPDVGAVAHLDFLH